MHSDSATAESAPRATALPPTFTSSGFGVQARLLCPQHCIPKNTKNWLLAQVLTWIRCVYLSKLLKLFWIRFYYSLHNKHNAGSRVRKNWMWSLFPNLLFLLTVSGVREEIRGVTTPSFPIAPVPRDGLRPPDITPGSWWGIRSEGYAHVVSIVLKCYRFHRSKEEKTLPVSGGWQSHS